MSLYRPDFIVEWLSIIKSDGIKGLIRQKGLKIVLLFIGFYLVRDGIIYVLLPYLSFKGLVSCN